MAYRKAGVKGENSSCRPVLLSPSGRLDFPVIEAFFGFFDVIIILQAQPEPFAYIKIPRKPECGIGGDSPFSMANLIDTSRRYADSARQRILAQAHRFQKILQQYVAGMNIIKFFHNLFHRYDP